MRWGLIGTSGFARKAAAPAFAAVEEAELVAVLSSELARARSFADEHVVETACEQLDEFLDAPGLEAIWIATPTFLHHRQALAALHAGKHVLLEKPLAMTSAQGWELVDAARRAGVVLATGYQARYVPAHRTMRTLIADGAIGDVSVARTYYGVHRPGPPPEWREQRATANWERWPTSEPTTSISCECFWERFQRRRESPAINSVFRPRTSARRRCDSIQVRWHR